MTDVQAQNGRPPDQQSRQPLAPGTQVDHYVIHSVLGAGGFGITYLASHNLLGRLYAIKEYFPDEFSFRDGSSVRSTAQSTPTYKWGLDRFLAEAQSLAKFKHPSIVDVVSVFESNDTAYMVLAYEQGRDLSHWIAELGRPPTQGEVDKIVVALLSALEAVHARNLLHRDIAPDNILIRRDGTPVLIDFGSARESIRGHSKVISAIVKRGYSPPEQYTSRPELQGPWSDIYALGATVYKMLVGKMPIDATDRMLDDNLRPIGELASGAYRMTFLKAVDRALAIQAKERPQSVMEWRDELFRQDAEVGQRTISERLLPGLGRPSPSEHGSSRPGSGPPPSRPPSGHAAPAKPVAKGDLKADLAWLDEDEDGHAAKASAAASRQGWIGLAYWGAIGLGAGVLIGALSSIVLASIFATRCSGDSCISGFLPVCALIGAVVGLGAGLRYGHVHRELPAAMSYREPDNL